MRCLSVVSDVQLEGGPVGLELRREGQVCTGRRGFRVSSRDMSVA